MKIALILAAVIAASAALVVLPHLSLGAIGLGLGLAAMALLLALGFARRDRRSFVVIDGENVMHWRGGAASLEPVARVARLIESQGLRPCVVFGQPPDGSGRHPYSRRALALDLGLPPSQIILVAPGHSTDLVILKTARKLAARVVTNDRFRDWEKSYPEVRLAGFLRTGKLNDGQLVLN